MERRGIIALFGKSFQSFALLLVLASCSQIVILQPADIIEEDAPTVSFSSITPGEFSASTSEVRVFGSSSENTHIVKVFSDTECSELLQAGTPDQWESLGFEMTLASNRTTSLHAIAATESGLESDCTHLVDFTHASVPALGLALSTPATSPSNDSTPAFVTSVDGGGLLSATDKITLHSGTSCAGAPLNVDEATVSTHTVDGVSAATTTLTLAASSAQVAGGAFYSVKRVNAEGDEKCSSEFSVSGQRSVFYEYDNVDPVAPDFTGGSHSNGDFITSTTPTFTGAPGSVEGGSTVNVTVVGGGGSSCSAVAAADGSWSCTLAPALTGGASVALTINVEQVDTAGNTSPADSFTLTLDTVAPGIVSAGGISPNGSSPINDTTPTVSGVAGSAVAGNTVNVSVTGSGSASCSTTVAGDGSWTCDVAPALTGTANTMISFTVDQTDPAGNTSSAVNINVILDTVDPAAPVISSPIEGATLTDGSITVSGTAEMNAAVTVDGESASCSDTANGAGAWSCTLDASLENGTYTLRVVQTDAAGNGPSVADTHSVTVAEPYQWSHQAYLKAPNSSSNDEFGSSVVVQGDTIVVGAPNEDSNATTIVNGTSGTGSSGRNDSGAAYVYRRSGNTWAQEAYIKTSNASAEDQFGTFVSIDKDTLVVPAAAEDSNTTAIIHGTDLSATNDAGDGNGAVYVFKRSGTSWEQEAYLKAPNSSDSDVFGSSVSISGQTIVVGASRETSSTLSIINDSDLSGTNNLGNNQGAAYVFRKEGDTWGFESYLKAANASENDFFGFRVAISGDTIAVSSPGESSSTTSIIHGGDLSSTNNFGAVPGAVYVFNRSGTNWSPQAYLKAPNNTSAIDQFGESLAIEGDTIVVGSHKEDSNTSTIINGSNLSATNDSGSNTGAVYVFNRSGSTWSHQAYLKAPNSSNQDTFGISVAVSGDIIVVGSQGEDSDTRSIINGNDLSATNDTANNTGAAYVFRRNSGNWSHTAFLKAPNATDGDFFGGEVSISGGTVVVGAEFEESTTRSIINGSDLSATNDSGNLVGAAYVFTLSDMPAAPGIAFDDPSSSPGNATEPGFNIDFSGDSLVATDIIELYGQIDCGGDALQVDQATIGNTQFSGSTAALVALTVAVADGQADGSTRTYSVKRTNADGYSVCSSANGDPAKQFLSYAADVTPPGDVTISTPADAAVTNDNQFTVSGTGIETGGTVYVNVSGGGNSSCSTSTDEGGGTWSCTLSSTLTGGASVALTVYANQEDAAGNPSDNTDSHSVTLDTVAPSAPVISSPSEGATETVGAFTVSGTAEMNAAVSVTVDGETADCSDTANGAGAWSCVLDEALANGTYTVRVVQTDAAGNGPSTADTHSVTVAIPAPTYQWSHEAYLKPTNPTSGDHFGRNVAISGDTAIIGTYYEDSSTSTIINDGNLSPTNNGMTDAGAAYTFTRSGSTWSAESYLKAPSTTSGDWFAWAVDIDGDTAIVSGHLEDSTTTDIINGADLSSTNDSTTDTGAAYVFKRTGGTWAHEAYLKAPNATSGDWFGHDVSISGDTVLVSTHFEDSSTTSIINGSDLSTTNNGAADAGAAYIFVRDGSTWSHEAYLKAPNAESGDYFGFASDLSGDTALIGAYFENSGTTSIISGADLSAANNAATNAGAAYVFTRSGSTWSHEAYLKAPNAEGSDQFGYAVALSGDTAIIGANVEASMTTAVINGSDLSSALNGAASAGAAYIFRRSSGVWSHEAYLKAPNATAGDNFGFAVGVSGNRAVVGAYFESSSTTDIIHGADLSSTNDSSGWTGAAYVFERNGVTWSHDAYLKAPNATSLDQFGVSVGISGGTVVVGSYGEDSSIGAIINGDDLSGTNDGMADQGAAYIFTLSDMPAAPGIVIFAPAASPGSIDTATFTIDFSGENLLATDTLELFNETECTGDPIKFHEYGDPTDLTSLTGVATTRLELTVQWEYAQVDGSTVNYSVKRTNSNGHSVCSDTNGDPGKQYVSYTYDNTPPSDVTISSPTDGAITNNTQFTVSGSGLEADGTVEVTVTGGGGESCSTSTDLGGGTWSCTLDGALTGGASVSLTVSADQVDAAGNTSDNTDSHSVTLDTVAPSAPVISSPADSSTETVGAFTVSGSGEMNATVNVTVDGETADCSDTANGAGAWSCTLDEALDDGTYTVRVVQTDAAGNGPSVADTHSVTVAVPYQWSHQAYLKAPNAAGADYFGFAVSLSGDTAIIGAHRESSNSTAIINGDDLSSSNSLGSRNGAAYVFKRSGGTWIHEAYLKAPITSNHDYFGYAVSVSGDTAIVGARQEGSTTTAIIHGTDLSSTNDSGTYNGAAYVFQRSGSTWSHEAYLKAPNASNFDYFGTSLSLSGDTVAIGAQGEASTSTAIVNGSDLSTTNDSGGSNGAVYIFQRSDSTWSHQAYLKSPNNSDNDGFGESLDISGDTVAVGALYEDSNTTSIINGSDLSSANDSGSSNGAVYIFQRSGSTWTHQAYLKAPNNSNSDYFGTAVSISSDTAVVGASGESSTSTAIVHGSDLSSTNDSGSGNGAVYVFQRSGSTWTHQAFLKAPNTLSFDSFGTSVSVFGDTAIIGASGEDSSSTAIVHGSDLSSTNDSGSTNGAAYVFQRTGSTWSHQAYLKAPNTSNSDYFGTSVHLSGDTAIVGASGEASSSTSIVHGSDLSSTNDSGGGFNGAAYVFELSDMPAAPGIAYDDPTSSPANDGDPSFTIDFSGDNLVATDIVELYGQIDCGGSALEIDEATVGTTQLNGSTASSITLAVHVNDAQADGTTRSYSVKRTNSDGYSICSSANGTPAKQYVSYSMDDTPPGDVTISSPADGALTNDVQFTVSGSGLEAGGTVEINVTGGGGEGCSTSTDLGGGTWSCTLDGPLTGGASVALTVSADQVDTAGNYSNSTDSHSLTLDTVDPSAPVISSPVAAATLSSGDITVSGSGEMNATVNVTVDGETADCSDTANGAGAWSCALDETLSDGAYTIRVTQTDAAGNGPSTADTHAVTVTVPYQWSHQAYLKAPNASSQDYFGSSVSISGDTALLGAKDESSSTTSIINGSDLSSTNDIGSDNGAAYVFTRSGSTWTHEAYLKAPNSSSSDNFGHSVSLSGDIAAVSANREDSSTSAIINGTDLSSTNTSGDTNGAVYIFRRTGSTWVHEAYLKAPNNTIYDGFGESVSISGETVLVGSIGEDSNTTAIIQGSNLSGTNNSGNATGAVYVFKKSGISWEQEAFLKAPNPSNTDRFGMSVNISGDQAVVGATFEASTSTSIINGSDFSGTNNSGDRNGAVYVFSRDDTTWSYDAYLKAPNSSMMDFFGAAVSVSGDTVLVGAHAERSSTTAIIHGSDLSSTNDSSSEAGAAYVFRESGGNWSHEAYLKAPNASNSDRFGTSVDIDGDFALIGAAGESSTTTSIIHGSDLSSTNDSGISEGAAYLFKRDGSTWTHEAYFKAPNAHVSAGFGNSVSLSGNTALVGSSTEDSSTTAIIYGSDLSSTNTLGSNSGAAYVFRLADMPAATGIAFNTPATSPSSDSTPSFTIDFSGENLSSTDIIELHGQMDCGGDALQIDEATIGNDQFSGSTGSSITLTVAAADMQAEGNRVYSVKRTNPDGYSVCSSANGDPAKQFVSYSYDNTPPGNVTISSPVDGAVTNNNQFTVSGSGLEADATVNVAVTGGGGTSCSTSTDLGAGTWSCTLSSSLTGGAAVALTVSAVQQDLAGNYSATPDSHSLTLDTVDPSAPVISSPSAAATLTNGDITVSGSGEMNATVNVTVDGATADCSDTANGAGAWSCTLDEALSNGAYTIRVTQTDAAGNGPSTADTHVVTVAVPTWAHQAYLKAPNPNDYDYFGNSVSVSGDTAIVGANGEDSQTTAIINGSDLSSTDNLGNGNGAAYVFKRSSGNWSLEAYLKPPNLDDGDGFGWAVTVDGNTAAVGATLEDSTSNTIIHGTDLSSANDSGNENGAVYIFTRSGSTWSHEAYLKAPNTSNTDRFGTSLSLSGETLVVGAQYESSNSTSVINGSDLSAANNSGSHNGAAYVFRRDNGVWTHEAYLKASNTTNQDNFAEDVDISGDTIVVGAHGEDSTTTAILHGTDLSSTNNSGDSRGAAYVYQRSGNTWVQQAYLKTPNPENNDYFGRNLSVSNDTIVVGSPIENSTTTAIIHGSDLSSTNNSGNTNGAAYVYTRSGSTWSMEAYLKAPNNVVNYALFGSDVDVEGDMIVVGAYGEKSTTTEVINGSDLSSTVNTGLNYGAAYVFKKTGGLWEHMAYLKAPNASASDMFGAKVNMSGNTVIVGSTSEDSTTNVIINGTDLSSTNDSGIGTGAAYVFALSGVPMGVGLTLDTPATTPGNDATPRFIVTPEISGNFVASDVIEIYGQLDCGGDPLQIDEATSGTTEFSGSTNADEFITIASASAQSEGLRYYSAKRTNGDHSVCSNSFGVANDQFVAFELDTTPPGDVSISSPADSSITNDTQFTISGSGLTAGNSVNVSVTGSGSASCSTSTDLGGGTWSCTLSSALTGSASASLTVSAEQEDAAGNTSLTPDSITVTLDTFDPSAPAISSPLASASLSDGDVTVSGTAEFNASVAVTVDGQTADCSTTANGAGAWSCTLDETLAAGSYTIRATQTDAAGNGPSLADTVAISILEPYQWSLQAYIKASNNGSNDRLGSALSFSGDTVVAGAYAEDSLTTDIVNGTDLSGVGNGSNDQGAAYVFKRNSGLWQNEAYLKGPNSRAGDQFGWSVAIDGDTIAVGARYEDSNSTAIIHGTDLSASNTSGYTNGAVYVFHRDGSTWSHQAYLKAPNAANSAHFGDEVSISGDTIAVGVKNEDSTTSTIINGDDLSSTNTSGNAAGAVYVFRRTGNTWAHEAYLKGANTSSGDYFGSSVSISGDSIAVGAYLEDSSVTTIDQTGTVGAVNNSSTESGAVYVFQRSGSTWSPDAYIKAPNNSSLDRFGFSVSLSGDFLAVGAIYEDSTSTTVIHGSVLSDANDSGDNNGAAYVYRRESNGIWGMSAYFKAPNTSDNDNFGSSVAINDHILVVGSPDEESTTDLIIHGNDLSSTNDGGTGNGAAYVYLYYEGAWDYSAYLKAPDTASYESFGDTVAVSGDTVAIGAYGKASSYASIINGSDLSADTNGGSNEGAVYIFGISDFPTAPGITLNSPATSYGIVDTPSFTVDFSGENLLSDDSIRLYDQMDCRGWPIDFDEATSGGNVFSGSTASSITLTPSTAHTSGEEKHYSVSRYNYFGYSVCSNANGDPSKQYASYTYVVSAPATPTITGPTGRIASSQFEVTGTGLAEGATIHVKVVVDEAGSGAASLAECTTSTDLTDGSWACTLDTDLGANQNNVQFDVYARQSLGSGNYSGWAGTGVTIDNVAPLDAPEITTPSLAQATSIPEGLISFSGTRPDNGDTTVRVTVDGETASCISALENSTAWSCTLDESLSAGSYTVRASQYDDLGNGPSPEDTLAMTVVVPTWEHDSYLKAGNGEGIDQYGLSVAIDGDRAIVGARREDSTSTTVIENGDYSSANNSGDEAGAAYIYGRSGNDWTEKAYIKAPNVGSNPAWFGESVAVSGETFVVGAPMEYSTTSTIINGSDLSSTNELGTDNGAVYVFIESGENFIFQSYLKPTNMSNGDLFGSSVAIDGDTIAVGASDEESTTTAIIHGTDLSSANDSGLRNGAVYIFTRSGTTWSQEAYLKAPNSGTADYFGESISLDGDTIVVGASGEDSTSTSIINGTNLSSANNIGNGQGAAYVFTRSGSTWTHQAYLKAPRTSGSDQFGSSVSVSGDTIVVGSPGEDSSTSSIIHGSDLSSANYSGSNNGAAYVFTRSGSVWTHEAYLKAPNSSSHDNFGDSVSIVQEKIVVGAYNEDSSGTSIIEGDNLSSTDNDDVTTSAFNGAAYVFNRSAGTWTHEAYLKGPNTEANDYFGYAVDIDYDGIKYTIISGALGERSSTTGVINSDDLSSTNNSAPGAGAAYIFSYQ